MVDPAKNSNQETPKQTYIDPEIIRAARYTYQNYYQAHQGKIPATPIGVAVDTKNYRGTIMFHDHPIILPRECFVPMAQLEGHAHPSP
ncbi:MAG: hypothetical protein HC796_00570 [Synechococcaceae cyanobacterium RL_1_2]|nr:hypothetical protein [Synechococcaceae cyanobacterium RL_1_2]